jgi:hypothetical protein
LSLVFTAFAYFDDTEVSIGNTFQAGIWAVDVNGGGSSAAQTFQGLASGDSGTKAWTVTDTGTIPAYVDLNVSVSESGTGHLENYLMARLSIAGGSVIHDYVLINDIAGSYNLNLPLDAGKSKDITLDWNVNSGYTPDANDKVVVTINFDIKPTP